MPTVLRHNGFRFFFYSSDVDEPSHIHVEYAGKTAKVWLKPLRLAYSDGFNRSEISKMLGITKNNTDIFLEAWNEYVRDI